MQTLILLLNFRVIKSTEVERGIIPWLEEIKTGRGEGCR